MLAITIDRHTKPYAVTASIAVTLFATSLQPSLHHLPPPHFPSNTLLFCSFIWASVSESESRLARTCWSRYAHRSAEGEGGRGRGRERGRESCRGSWEREDITSVRSSRLAVFLLVWHDIAPLAVQRSCFSSTFLPCFSLSSLPLHYDIYCHFSCHLQNAANGKIINIKIKL